ncbi:hypothetical protein S140_6 [Shewanella sp. phage 1/40]|uniref:hypothetical protein n=1 Tax=Shewanella sp. phage 1/40 TaxID=1458860 RepID=UPI0004F5D0FD|nr:hypothetical protein S140_6 [Shewanella sp. phage 1/40]AHK11416.1 hypothetical protein S140_6 [Shewanella sp. phage 1/40]
MNIEDFIKNLNTKELKEILDNNLGEYWHEDQYGVDISYVFKGGDVFNHVEYSCVDKQGKTWMGHPDDIVGKIIHIDGIYDEYNNREDSYEGDK